MKNIKLTIEYDGTSFCGWQNQPRGRTVQNEIEKALSILLKKKVKIYGAGRTDSGVHALGQVANFKEKIAIPTGKIPLALNGLLPEDIVIKSAEEMDPSFHARYSAVGKKYIYKINNTKFRKPLLRNYAYLVPYELDLEKMITASKYFIGEHDFKGFMASGSSVKNTVRTIYSFDVCMIDNMIIIETRGNGFLYNMVRIMVGTLVDVGRNKIKAHELPLIIGSGIREKAKHTAKAQGLYLAEVYYD